ncbi:aromatic amino acid aminotransferase [Sphingopyxis sp. Root1497]|uniref:amino acid aminotransferase n=1 Tax=Sphingopyxis sp. Root1497 TaxID=1736474 RepID=UPI0006F5B20C|nr:amino acid aminotransferase [Sphingopyxis sp. Root1497]KQZ61062.1 aromatic amino acid aminotransferase [Sphingopyxis sp. Root1497]
MSGASLLTALERQPADALLAVIGLHRADPRPDKIDVGVGVYRDASGATPVMRAVKRAEARLLAEQQSKSYLGAEGDQRYTDLLAEIALGPDLAASDRITGVQTPGGTGALRLGAELLARARAGAVWVGTPTWPNHEPIFREAGLTVRRHAYFDASAAGIDEAAFFGSLAAAAPGDVVLLHGCCHNPTGTALSPAQWRRLADMAVARGLTPFVDLAYQGLGQGLDADAAGVRRLLSAVPEALVAYSCDKNFALYRDRVGALWVQSAMPQTAVPVRETMLVLARSLWSMPPDHGAAIVRTILEDPELAAEWRAELEEMCARINGLRSLLAAVHPALAPIARQQGLFALLPIDGAAVEELRAEHAIYMPASGRINIAGLNADNVGRFAAAIASCLGDTAAAVTPGGTLLPA